MSESPSLNLPWSVKVSRLVLSIGAVIMRYSALGRWIFTDSSIVKVPSSPDKPFMGVKSVDVTVDSTRKCWFRLFTPSPIDHKSSDSMPLIFFFHGGGFSVGSPDNRYYDRFCRSLVQNLEAAVISVNYRLTPHHRWPCQYEDCFEVLRYFDENPIPELPMTANFKYSFLAGDSAGGNIAHHIAVKASRHDFSKLNLIGVVSVQPFFGGEERTASETELTKDLLVNTNRTDRMWRNFLPQDSDRNHPACNVIGPNADISKVRFPPTIIAVGTLDPLKDWQKRYYNAMKAAKHDVTLVEYYSHHAFYLFPQLPDHSKLMKDVKIFMEKQISVQ